MISDLDGRRMLRSVLFDVYENVVDYNMKMYELLEKRIYSETSDFVEKFYIYTCIEMVDKIDPIDDFLHPMVPDDLVEAIYDMAEINERLRSGEPVVIASVYMKCPATVLKKLLDQKKAYKGSIKTDRHIHEVNVQLKPCRKYVDVIEKLYRAFQNNGIEWKTINCPYAYKFVDVILDTPLSMEKSESIKEISVELAEYEKFRVPNVIPLWNVAQIEGVEKEFPALMPMIDRIVYEHTISLDDHGVQNGYLVDFNMEEKKDFIYSRRKEKELVIVSTSSEQATWGLIKIENIENADQGRYMGEMLTNKRDLGFTGRYSSVKSMVIRTRGEIARLLQSYEDISNQLIFREVEIYESYHEPPETFDLNSFIDDNIRVDSYKKIMLMLFGANNRDDYLLEEKMSFLVSEIQILFPEYKCIGELVE